jgi:C4-dicarboxylate-specific signal transduction histidine kinase
MNSPSSLRSFARQLFAAVLLVNLFAVGVARARRPHDNSDFLVEAFLCPIGLRGQNLILGCVRDITERRANSEELQRYRNHLEILVQERTEELARAVEETKRETTAVEELRHKERLLIQQSRLAAMGEMMGNIAHQWRQPLNVLGLIVQELQILYLW